MTRGGFLLLALGLYLIVRDGEGFRRYMWSIMLTFGFATIFCALVPNGQDLRPAVMMEHHNFCTWLLQNTYNLDTNTNVLPSVHVLGVLDALYAVHRTPGLRTGWRTFADIWGVIIICSITLFCQSSTPSSMWWRPGGGWWWAPSPYVIIYTIIGGRRDPHGGSGKGGPPVENIPILEGISPDEVRADAGVLRRPGGSASGPTP